jgi:hypothetical protein
MIKATKTTIKAFARLRSVALVSVGLILLSGGAASSADSSITLGGWRTEPGKSLVCGDAQENLIIKIASSANKFYANGAKSDSPEYEVYWSTLQSALKGQRCFVTDKMTHQPHLLVYDGPESLEASGKRFKVVSTSIKTSETVFPGYTMTTLAVKAAQKKDGDK